jgi:hypothetical protein
MWALTACLKSLVVNHRLTYTSVAPSGPAMAPSRVVRDATVCTSHKQLWSSFLFEQRAASTSVVASAISWRVAARSIALVRPTPIRSRFAAGARRTENVPIVDDFEHWDRQQKAAARARTGFVGRLGVRSGDEPGLGGESGTYPNNRATSCS